MHAPFAVREQAKHEAVRQHEFAFSLDNFKYIQARLFKIAGIELSDKKQPLVYSRLSRRVRALGMQTFDQYCDLIAADDSGELVHFINALTTNKTAFFRESHHFDYLKQVLIPQWKKSNKRSVHIWCAASSTGEEPYSIASMLATYGDNRCDYSVLATDLDTNVLREANRGVYNLEQAIDIPDAVLKNCFLKGTGHHEGMMRVKQTVKEIINFKQLNLNSPWPSMKKFDVIFCRNVFIYFNNETQQQLIGQFYKQLTSQGTLFLGHSESIGKMKDRFATVGRTTFLKQNLASGAQH